MNKIIITVVVVVLAVVGGALILVDSTPERGVNTEGVSHSGDDTAPVSTTSTEDDSQSVSDSDTLAGIAGDVELKKYDGETVKLTDFVGEKNLIINSWAIWCPFCVEELKDFAEVQNKFSEEVQIMAVNRAESKNKTQDFISKLGVAGDLTYLLDSGDNLYQSIGGFSMPETIFVNQEGEIVFHKRGPMDASEITSRINELFSVGNTDDNS